MQDHTRCGLSIGEDGCIEALDDGLDGVLDEVIVDVLVLVRGTEHSVECERSRV